MRKLVDSDISNMAVFTPDSLLRKVCPKIVPSDQLEPINRQMGSARYPAGGSGRQARVPRPRHNPRETSPRKVCRVAEGGSFHSVKSEDMLIRNTGADPLCHQISRCAQGNRTWKDHFLLDFT